MTKKLFVVVSLLISFSMLLAACAPSATQIVTQVVKETVPPEVQTQVVKETQIVVATSEVQPTATPAPVVSTRKGGWVDQIVFTEQNDASAAVKQIQADDIDVYAYSVSDPALFSEVKSDPNLAYTTAFGSYTELTFNPHGPTFNDGRLNPFGDAKVREAMNWLVDRNYIVQEIYGGLANVKVTSLNSAFPDYARYIATVRALEVKYAYNPDQANTVITTEMEAMGATKGADGKWEFNGDPVTIILIIRTEDERKEIGDYVANQLETVGFTTDRQYKTRTEASPIWNSSDPAEGLWNIYTGGWITTAISRDDATNFGYFYTPLGSGSPLWQAYVNDPAYYKGDGTGVAEKLWVNDFKTMDERATLFEEALNMAQLESERVWLVDQTSFSPQTANMTVAYDLAGGVAGSSLYPYTIRFTDQEGGVMRIATPGILVEPWNPVGGSNWIYDQTPQRATEDQGVLADPYTGLAWPQRIESADVVVEEGLPVAKTLDWLTLETAPSIEVPSDAWVDWDPVNMKFITVGEAYTSTVTALSKVTVTYPADFFTTVTWHDGEPISMGDFLMEMIMTFDVGKPDSANYDEALAPNVDAFISHFKGVVIESTDPLVITTYDDQYFLDAELMVRTWYPGGASQAFAYGAAPWQILALGNLADASTDPATELAWTTDKAGAKSVEWLSLIAGPSLDILKGWLDQAVSENYIPYAPTMSQYVTADEATARWASTANWYKVQGHFWIGSGPYYLDKAFPVEKSVSELRYQGYPDLASKWDVFGTPMVPVVSIDGPGQVDIGSEAVYTVYVTFEDQPYPKDKVDAVKFLVFDSTNAVVTQGDAVFDTDGQYTVTLTADDTAKLVAGSNKLEVVTTSLAVSIPAITDLEFIAK
jgi:peptide/nickel transport system substrate-binding protein